MKKLTYLFSILFLSATFLITSCSDKKDDKTEDKKDPLMEDSLEKDIKEIAECICEMGRIIQEMSDSDNLEVLNLQLEEQSEKCQKIEKEFEEKYKDDKEAAKEGESLMKKEMEDCEYL